MITERGIRRIQRAADRQESLAIRSCMASRSYTNPLGWGAIRSANAAAWRFRKAAQLRLALATRCQSEAGEKRERLKQKRHEFNQTAPWKKGKRGLKIAGTDNRDSPSSQSTGKA